MKLIDNYRTLGHKEFMHRWKAGIQNVTPEQQVGVTLVGQIIIVIGVLLGIYFTIKSRTWWLVIILIGSLFVTGVQILGTYQRKMQLDYFKLMMEEASKENEQQRTN